MEATTVDMHKDLFTIEPWDEHNQRTVANVHPNDWVNPEPAERYNLVVLGAGTAGLISAIGAAGLGAKVALIEKALMGGDCLNVGCVPSKALIRSSRSAAEIRAAHTYGVNVPDGVAVDFPKVMARMRRLRTRISNNDSAHRFQSAGVDVFIGTGTFTGPDQIEVGGKTLRFSKAVIATGARAAAPPIPGLMEAGYLTNETVFSLTELPRRLAVIGAGPIGCELSQAFVRFGSDVHLLEAVGRILTHEDRDAAARVEKALVSDGVQIITGCQVKSVSRRAGEKVVTLECDGERRELAVDEILVGVGRAPNVEGFGLDAAGVAFDSRTGRGRRRYTADEQPQDLGGRGLLLPVQVYAHRGRPRPYRHPERPVRVPFPEEKGQRAHHPLVHLYRSRDRPRRHVREGRRSERYFGQDLRCRTRRGGPRDPRRGG